MPFREKSAWACLITTVVVFVPYFAYTVLIFRRGILNPGSVIPAFVAAVIVQTVLTGAAHIGFVIRSKQEAKDERDIVIESKSFQLGYAVLVTASFVAITIVGPFVLAPHSAFRDPIMVFTFMSQVVLLCIILGEATKYGTRAVCYRRGS